MSQKTDKTSGRKRVLKKPIPEEESAGIESIKQLVEITRLQNKVLQSILKNKTKY